jgi:hypothetical protein
LAEDGDSADIIRADVSEKHVASCFRVEKIRERENCQTFAEDGDSADIFRADVSNLKLKTTYSSQTLAKLPTTTNCHLDDRINVMNNFTATKLQGQGGSLEIKTSET